MERMGGRVRLLVCCSISLFLFAPCAGAQQQVIGAPPEAQNMKLVGASDLQARSAYQPTIHHQGDRWIAYIGHHGGTDQMPIAKPTVSPPVTPMDHPMPIRASDTPRSVGSVPSSRRPQSVNAIALGEGRNRLLTSPARQLASHTASTTAKNASDASG